MGILWAHTGAIGCIGLGPSSGLTICSHKSLHLASYISTAEVMES